VYRGTETRVVVIIIERSVERMIIAQGGAASQDALDKCNALSNVGPTRGFYLGRALVSAQGL
jgi:hypothetical protein